MVKSFRSFEELNEFLQEEDRNLKLLVYPKLIIGAVFWIPDNDSRIGNEGAHPWVVISDFKPGNIMVTACLRTSSNLRKNAKKGLTHPAGILKGLDRDGVILTSMRKPFEVKKFRDYKYEGRLPQNWVEQLKMHMGQGNSK